MIRSVTPLWITKLTISSLRFTAELGKVCPPSLTSEEEAEAEAGGQEKEVKYLCLQVRRI
jgi:hypothetical protein